MSRLTKDERLANVHAQALAEFDRIQSAIRDERIQCLQDRRFYSIAGAQWEGALGEQFENKPKFEVNKIHLAVIRIINEYRNNRITVDFVSKDGKGDEKLADVCDGLYRADEQDSGAEEAYDNAFEEAVGGGFGAWRLRTVYKDEDDDDNDEQRIRIEPIYDADSCVFFDLDSKRQDKSDAKHCFVLTSTTPQAYSEEWDEEPASWNKDITNAEFDWFSPDVVFVAEYYRVEETREVIRIFQTVQGEEERYRESDFENDDELEAKLEAFGSKEIRQKRVKRQRVHKYIMSGTRILEDCGYIAGNQIPIVPNYGKRWFIDSVERCMGHVRLAKDSQRLKNMQLSKLGEIAALSSVEKPILTPEQILGHQVMWADDNIKNYPYLLINPITDAAGQQLPAGPVAYTKPPQVPQALAALLQITEQDMADILGNPQGADKMVSNISGKAVEMIQTRLDMQTFIYMSNMAKAIRRSGEIWLSMAKDVYVEEGREMKTVGGQGDVDTVELMRPTITDEKQDVENDLSKASFDVVVEVGPSSTSKRDATVRSLMNMMSITQDPQTLQVLQAMAMLNMEGEGISEVRDYFRQKLVQMGVIKPTEEEAQAMAQASQKPDANETYLMAAAEEAEANAVKARTTAVKTLADAELSRAKTAETLNGIGVTNQDQVVKVAKTLSGIRPTAPTDEYRGTE